ncbi:Methyltransferase domain-containing protein [Chitinophaga ginsengisegetis]|uniref:Methyltransferase domain-containing protein n=1 Tax=Chitinophaga ginsengisegetis TaxID=393003 RepID=A0A1T5NFE7_9BACT|nr:class I SAM-dependent methyltransferase [Chitinophaga ginsengisegetis]SKC99241.1 Methyltransferase domain-containing protein [Chitinophaga ginsengisegetis]
MKQNKYDDPLFFEKYSQMPRSVGGLNAAGEWYVLRSMIPGLKDKKVLDLGCGFGWHCRYAREQGAQFVVGVDISARMLERARATTHDTAIEYRQQAIEDIDFADGSFDVVISSLALHYVAAYEVVCRKVFRCLAAGGTFVLSVEHPVFTALAAQDWYYDEQGQRLHWPVDNYQQETLRQTRFLDTDVVKYHRTVATLLNTLMDAGFRITTIAEPQPTAEVIAAYPEMKDETRRPIFLLVAAVKPV